MRKKLIIAVDFDNCITNYAVFPKIGRLNTTAREVINSLYSQGHTIIINSCRNNASQKQAVDYLNSSGVKFHYFNENCPSIISKFGGDTRKIYANLYIDDRNPNKLNWDHINTIVDKLSKPTIICIVGESGSGKSTVANYIAEQYGINQVISRTTRPERYPGERGHLFVSEKDFDTYKKEDMLAFTKFGDYRYCCLKSDIISDCTYVIDEHGLDYMAKNFSDEFNIFSIRTLMDDKSRIKIAGEERVARDVGMFNIPIHLFNYILNNNKSKAETFRHTDGIINSIFINKLYSL